MKTIFGTDSQEPTKSLGSLDRGNTLKNTYLYDSEIGFWCPNKKKLKKDVQIKKWNWFLVSPGTVVLFNPKRLVPDGMC